MAADPQRTKVSRSLWVNTTEICQAKPQQREEQNWLWSFTKLTEIARNLCICSDSCQLYCFLTFFLFFILNEARVGVFLLAKIFHGKQVAHCHTDNPHELGWDLYLIVSQVKFMRLYLHMRFLCSLAGARNSRDALKNSTEHCKRFILLQNKARQAKSPLPQTHISTKRFTPRSQERWTPLPFILMVSMETVKLSYAVTFCNIT